MNICIVGAGYVGLVTGTCFAEMGNTVWCVDINQDNIDMLNSGKIPIYEPGLEEMVLNNVKEGRLIFTTDIKKGLKNSLFCFVAVGTPSSEDGSADLSHVLAVANSIGEHMDKYTVVVNKSTVPVGTGDKVKQVIRERLSVRGMDSLEFDVVSNPEFLKEGAAIEDFMRPDRVVIGTDNVRTAELMKELYAPFVRNQHPIFIMDMKSAELTKYAANAMLATRISFMNELALLCDKVGADIQSIRLGMGSDSRIGTPFLYAGVGYGGSCFPKDVRELIRSGQKNGVGMQIVNAVEQVNENQKYYIVNLLKQHFLDNIIGKKIGIWGLAFKPQTDDMREATSIVVIRELLKLGAEVVAYDPIAIKEARKIFSHVSSGLNYGNTMYDAVENVDALLLLTEWRQFRQPDFVLMREKMKTPVIFDGRNQYNAELLRELGFQYYSIGRSCR